MKTLLILLAGLGLMTGTVSARDHHYRHHGGGYVRHYSGYSGYSVGPRFGFSIGTGYVDPYYADPYAYGYGPVYSRPYYPYYYGGPSVYVSGSRYYGGNRYYGRSYHRGGHSHHHHR